MEHEKDILDILHEDHEAVASIIEKLENASPRASKSKETDFTRLQEALLPHAQGEEELFYPRLMDDKEQREHVLEGYEEHHLIKTVIHEMMDLDFNDEHWTAKLAVLKDLIEHHVDEEESELFDIAQDALSDDERSDIGRKFEARKKELKATVSTMV